MVELSKLHAVATGDIVESSDLPADRRRQLPDRLRSTYETVQQTAPEELPYELAITGGDGWQCYVRNPATALARLLHFWTLLYAQGLPSRMALVVDTVDFVSEEDLNESDGRGPSVDPGDSCQASTASDGLTVPSLPTLPRLIT